MITFYRKKFSLFRSSISIILILSLLVTIIPVSALASPSSNEESGQQQPEGVELVELRTEFAKVYGNPDGTRTAKVHSEPIHYKDSAGKFQDIDNTIIESSDPVETPEFKHQNGANKYKVFLAPNTSVPKTVKIKQGNYSIAFNPVGANNVAGITNGNSIAYPGAFNQADLLYKVNNSSIKEEIILHRFTGQNSFSFELSAKNLIPKLEPNNSITFNDSITGEKVWAIGAPFAEDANDVFSGDLTYTLENKGSGNYLLTISVSKKYLEDPQRSYPVRIDPTVTTNPSADSYIMSAYPTYNYYNSDELRAGYTASTGICRSYLDFNLPSLEGGIVHSSYLKLYEFTGATTGANILLTEILYPWSNTTINWNNRPVCNGSDLGIKTVNGAGWYSWNVTNTVAAWYSGRTQYGFMFREDSENDYYRKFYSNDYSNSAYRPVLEVTYARPAAPTATAGSSGVNTGRGWLNLSWSPTTSATGYNLLFYNGYSNQEVVSTTGTSWNSQNTKIFPTDGDLINGSWGFRTAVSPVPGSYSWDLKDDPRQFYTNAYNTHTGSFPDYRNVQHYSVCAQLYRTVSVRTIVGSSDDSTNYTLTSNPSAANTFTLPDSTRPNSPLSQDITVSGNPIGSVADITVNWKGVTDPTTGSNSGTKDYTVELVRTDLITNTSTTVSKVCNHIGSDIAHSTVFTGQPLSASTKFQAKITAKDNNGNYTNPVTSSNSWIYDHANPSVIINTPANNSTVSGTTTVSSSGSDENGFDKMKLEVRKYGTNDVQDLGFITGTNASWAWDTTKNIDGEYVLTVTGYDIAGNTATASRNVKVDNAAATMGLDHWGTVSNRFGAVNIANGNFTVTQNDINLPGRGGLGTNVTRVYNSQLKTNGVLGWGWRLGVPELSQFADGNVLITDGDGTELFYTRNGDGTYNRPVGNYTTLTNNGDGTFTWKFKDGTKFIFDSANRTTTLKDKNNNTVVYLYDAANKLTRITDPTGRQTNFTYNGTTGRLASVTDYGSRTWTYAYDDANHNLIKVTDPLNHTVQFAYDANHQLTSITDSRNNTTSFGYTGNLFTSVNEPLGVNTVYGYDGANNRFVVTDPRNNSTTYIHDGNGNIVSITDALNHVTSFTYDTNYNKLTETDANNHTTTWTYDAMGNILTERDPGNHTTIYTYDGNNNVLTVTDALNNTTTNSYDANGNLLSDGTNTYTYNANGLVATVTDGNNHTTTYGYDAHGNLTSVTNSLNKTTTYGYNTLNFKTSETDEELNTTTYTYNLLGQMLTVTVPVNQTTTYTYDNNGNRLTAIDAANNLTSWAYDALNRITSVTEPGNKVKSYTYDLASNILTETAPDNTTTTYAYNALNRLTTVTYHDGRTISYGYDNVANKTSMTDANGTTTYVYDACDLLASETAPGGKQTSYAYDATHKQTGKTVTIGGIDYSYTYNFDTKGYLANIVDNAHTLTTSYAYDAAKNIDLITYGNSNKLDYSYDADNRVTNLKNLNSANLVISGLDYTYTYYDNDQVKTVLDSRGTTTYAYDGQNRLETITDPTGKITKYYYDAAGNRTKTENTVSGNTTTFANYTYGTANQLQTATYSDGTVTYGYDTNGNITSRADSRTGTTSYQYNTNNQLIRVTKPNNDIIEFAYDGENRRISKKVNGVETKYVYDGDLIAAETNAAGTVLKTYLYDDKGSPVSVTIEGSPDVTYFFHYNGHGDTVALTDSSGNVVATTEYDVWGNVINQTGNIENPFGYAGQFGYVYDKETGLYFLKSRYYDPEIGQFTSKDRFKGFENRPASQNPYTYCENDPINGFDPSGYLTLKINLGFNGYVKFVTGWFHIDISFNITPGMLINVGIGVAVGFGISALVGKFLWNWLYPTITTIVFTWIAKKVTSKLAGYLAKKTFGVICGGNSWLYRSLWSGSFRLGW